MPQSFPTASFSSPLENNLRNIFNHAKEQLVDPRETRTVIFVSDFKLEFDVPVGQVVGEMCEMMHYFESCGHMLTFAFLPFPPALSRNPTVKPTYQPSPDHTSYIVSLNNQI